MTVESLLDNYGYVAIIIGTLLEGETILVLAGIAAKLGYFKLPWVMVCAFCGTLAGDQFFFLLGRRRGQSFLEKHPLWQPKVDKISRIMERHRIPVILGFRFLYGLRIVTPVVIGMSRIPKVEFLILNIISAALWAIVISLLGYAFGHALEYLLGDIRHYEKAIFGGILLLGAAIWTGYLIRNKKNSRRQTENHAQQQNSQH